MRRLVLGIGFCLFVCMQLFAQSVVKESLRFHSEKMGQDIRYSVYLPDGYNVSDRKYPVLYLLHGWTDNETSWLQMGNMQRITDDAIKQGIAIPMIIIMPDAGESWYVNSYDGKIPYEDMFFEELIPFVQQTYKVRTEQQYRAIAGLSMGGYGAFLYTLHHPDYFTACAPLSAAIYTEDRVKESLHTTRGKLFDRIYGKGNLTEHWYKNSVLHLLKDWKEDTPLNVLYYIDCGDDDVLLHGNNEAHELLQQKGK